MTMPQVTRARDILESFLFALERRIYIHVHEKISHVCFILVYIFFSMANLQCVLGVEEVCG